MTNTNTPEPTNRLDYVAAIKKHITEHIDNLVTRGNLNITEENYLDLSFKLRAVASKYALEDQYKPKPKMLDIIGNLHTSAAVRKYLNITQEELNKLVEDHRILKLTDGKGRNGYPAVQFKNGTIRPDLQKIIKTYLDFPHPLDPTKPLHTPWDVAFDLGNKSLNYGGRTLAEHLDKYPEKLDEEIDRLLAHLNTSACYY
jgi:hypothetical protein